MFQFIKKGFYKPIIPLLLFITLPACNSIQSRINNADLLSSGHHFSKKIISTDLFDIVSYQKIHSGPDEAVFYIEGDGLAWKNRYRISSNPTPANPIGLKLAMLDDSQSVIYLGRPCQYVYMENQPECKPEYWTNKRASPEVVKAINTAINKIKYQSGIKRIRLVGYSGGATIAAILAATRDDIIDLRTIAGNLDINLFSQIHNVSIMSGSLNPVDFSDKLVNIPQINLVSTNDHIITPEIIESYLSNLRKYDSKLKCVRVESLSEPTHSKGWEETWKKQLTHTHHCNGT